MLNTISYINDDFYTWKESVFIKSNERLASYINKKYSDSVLGLDNAVRGYINLLFKRGVHEGVRYDTLKEIAKSRGKKHFVLLLNDFSRDNGLKIKSATVYDTDDNVIETIDIDDNGKMIKN